MPPGCCDNDAEDDHEDLLVPPFSGSMIPLPVKVTESRDRFMAASSSFPTPSNQSFPTLTTCSRSGQRVEYLQMEDRSMRMRSLRGDKCGTGCAESGKVSG